MFHPAVTCNIALVALSGVLFIWQAPKAVTGGTTVADVWAFSGGLVCSGGDANMGYNNMDSKTDCLYKCKSLGSTIKFMNSYLTSVTPAKYWCGCKMFCNNLTADASGIYEFYVRIPAKSAVNPNNPNFGVNPAILGDVASDSWTFA